MIILTVNAGSSSIRLDVFLKNNKTIEKLAGRKYNVEENPSILKNFIRDNDIKGVSAIAHRIVHGGSKFVSSCLINESVESGIKELSSLAPLHNPFALKWIQECKKIFGGNMQQVAVFDTAFYSNLPESASFYALPKGLCRQYNIRRYGFHGLAHNAILRRWIELRPDLKKGGKLISLQLGAGSSITAVHNGEAMDTSMGFSPLEGLVMATRPGDMDPEIILYLQRLCGLSADGIEEMLNRSSGLLGLSGISGDMRVLLESDDLDARLAVDIYCYRIRKYIGAYLAVLEGADAILFGGGVGENAPLIRERVLDNMHWLGIVLDSNVNRATIGQEGCISSTESKTKVWVVPVDEARVMAEETIAVIEHTQ